MAPVHHLTRSTLAAAGLIVAVGLAFAIQPRPAAVTQAPTSAPAQASGLEPRLTQRKGEWSPLCATTKEPLVDFSPVDRGTVRHRILLTVHNCSAQPVPLTEPRLWLGGREGMTAHLRLDAERTALEPITLAAWESAQAVLTWEDDAQVTASGSDVLSVAVAGIGEGELKDTLDLNLDTRIWLSGWTR